ncbi:16S rRNA (guanine(527)-N(7))-methyltransferase RsmG, partial [Elusimicrobiota bacterium]
SELPIIFLTSLLKLNNKKLINWLDNNAVDNSVYNRLKDYILLIQKEREVRNIIGSSDADILISRHILPSLELSIIIKGNHGIDIGSGNGLPGIIIAIMDRRKRLTLFESKKGKANFLQHAKREICLTNIDCVCSRAEVAAHDKKYREVYDFVTCRAVSNLRITSELSLPFLKIGGRYYAQRGKGLNKEIETSEEQIGALGGKIEAIVNKNIVIINKINNTPCNFPREWKKIKSEYRILNKN